MTKVIVPNFWYDTKKFPVIFLAGPIKCAPAWHEKAVKYLSSSDSDLIIACPKSKLEELSMLIIRALKLQEIANGKGII